MPDPLRIERAGGFVEEEQPGFYRDSTHDGYPLSLAPGQLARFLLPVFAQAEAAQELAGRAFGLVRRFSVYLDQGQGDVLDRGEMGKEVEALENGAHPPPVGTEAPQTPNAPLLSLQPQDSSFRSSSRTLPRADRTRVPLETLSGVGYLPAFALQIHPKGGAPMMSAATRTFPPFSLARLLGTVFDPIRDQRVVVLIDLDDPAGIREFAYLQRDYPVQRHAYEAFYRALHDGVMDELGLTGGEIFAYQITGGSNLDLPDRAVAPDGTEISLERDVYPNYDIVLCISTFSATAPLTAFARRYGFRGATLHGVNDVILSSGLCVDYREVAADAEKLRAGMTRADRFEIDFAFSGREETLVLHTNGQEAQKSQGLCLGREPDVANLPAGEIYYVPESADGRFPLKYEQDGTLGLMEVAGGRIRNATLLQGDGATVDAHNRRLHADPVTGVLGELGFGTQVLPVSGADIQDEKILGTLHVATGRSDHLGGDLTPGVGIMESVARGCH